MRKKKIKIELFRDREKTLDRNLASVTKALGGVQVQNASFRRSRGSIDDKIVDLEKDYDKALKAVTESSQQNVSQVSG